MRVSSFIGMMALASLSFKSSEAMPEKYKTGSEDPATCDGKKRLNPFPDKCGQRKGNFRRTKRDGLNSGDIVGGRSASRGEFPWFVDMDNCGATIVNERHLITAAHCFDGIDRTGYLVVAGSIHPMKEVLASFDPSLYCGVQIRSIDQVAIHPEYCSEVAFKSKSCAAMNQHDVAVVTLNRPLVFDEFVQPACLPDGDWTLAAGTMFDVVGNGYVDYDTRELTDTLQTVEVPMIEQEKCKSWLSSAGKVTEDMLCAGYEKGNKDSCVGDSGGPLFLHSDGIEKRNEKADADADADAEPATVLVGVVSWGVNCGQAKTPGVYARMDMALAWITSQTEFQTSRQKEGGIMNAEKPVGSGSGNGGGTWAEISIGRNAWQVSLLALLAWVCAAS